MDLGHLKCECAYGMKLGLDMDQVSSCEQTEFQVP